MPDFVHVVAVDDYHDFEEIAYSIKNAKAKSAECGFGEDGKYWGIIYTGRKPTAAAIKTLLEVAGFVPHSEFA